MALELYWYDSICFVIIGAALIGALCVLGMKEGAGDSSGSSMDEGPLLVGGKAGGAETDTTARVRAGGGGGRGGGRGGHVSYFQLWTSCWRGLNPAWLLGIRFSSFLILCACLGWDLMEWDASIFFYYTEWTFTLVIIYFGIGTIISVHGCVLYYYCCCCCCNNNKSSVEVQGNCVETPAESGGGTSRRHRHRRRCCSSSTLELLLPPQSQCNNHENKNNALQQPAGFWGYLMQTSYQTCAGAIILTDIIFWCVIVPFLSSAHLQVNLLSGSMHSLNLFFLLVDTSVNSLPFPWFRLSYFVLWSCCYVIFQWVIHACGYTWWPYPFLELSTPWAPFWYLCLAVIHIPCYGIYSLFVRAKNIIFFRLFPGAFVKY